MHKQASSDIFTPFEFMLEADLFIEIASPVYCTNNEAKCL